MLIAHLFVSYARVNLRRFFSSSWFQGLAATSACGSSWTFLFTFLRPHLSGFVDKSVWAGRFEATSFRGCR